MQKHSLKNTLVITLIPVILSLVSCATEPVLEITPLIEESQQSTLTPVPPTLTPIPPSATPITVAVIVNEDEILIEEYQAELGRYQAAVGRELSEEDREIVLNDLINLTLLAQAAYTEGFELGEADIQSKLEELDSEEQPLENWLAEYGYTEEDFQQSLKRALAAAWMRDRIIAEVPETAEQVHAQQMLYYTNEEAVYALSQLDIGIDFAQLAATRDPQTKGDLGWFPRGYLTVPKLDEVIFTLEVGEYSNVIETEIGFHIILLIEKEQDRLLPLDILKTLQEKALHDWIERRWKLSTIEITLP